MKKLALAIVLVAIGGATLAHRLLHRPDAVVTYYFIPGCSTCAKTSARLSSVLEPYRDRVALRLVENKSPEGIAAAKQYRFLSHGVVLLDRSGKAQLVESDHRVYPEHVVEALGRVVPGVVAQR